MGRVVAGFMGIVKSFTPVTLRGVPVSDVKVDPGGGHNSTPQHFSDLGDDSHALPGDYMIALHVTLTRSEVAGYLDPKLAKKSEPGDKRIYARDETTGLDVNEVWLKNDGTITITNSNGIFTVFADGSIKGSNFNGFFELESGGAFMVNGATIGTDGAISSPVSMSAPSVVANSLELAGHTHKAGTPPGDTGANQ